MSGRFLSRLLFLRAATNNQQLPVGLGSMRRGPLASTNRLLGTCSDHLLPCPRCLCCSTSSMYSQTASLLDSCAHNAGRAEGPQLITQAIALLAARLAAVARLRSVHCLRSEGHQQVQAFRAALEKASGETFQRPSPTDSNTSTAMSVPLDRGQHSGSAGSPPAPPGGHRGGSQPPAGPQAAAAAAAAGGATAAPPLLGLPKGLLERQLVAAQHSQLLLGALEAFRRTGQQLREFMCRAAAQVGRAVLWQWLGSFLWALPLAGRPATDSALGHLVAIVHNPPA